MEWLRIGDVVVTVVTLVLIPARESKRKGSGEVVAARMATLSPVEPAPAPVRTACAELRWDAPPRPRVTSSRTPMRFDCRALRRRGVKPTWWLGREACMSKKGRR